MIFDIALNKSIIVKKELDAAFQELDILFNTQPTELIGESEFGTNWEQFLWDVIPACNELQKYIDDKITQNCYWVNKFKHNVSVTTMDYEDRAESVYVVTITITYKHLFGEKTKSRNYIVDNSR